MPGADLPNEDEAPALDLSFDTLNQAEVTRKKRKLQPKRRRRTCEAEETVAEDPERSRT